MKRQITIEKQIVQYLIKKGVKYKWLSEKTKISPSHLSKVLNGTDHKRTLSEEIKTKINKALNTNF